MHSYPIRFASGEKKLQGSKSEKQGGQLESWGSSLGREGATWNGHYNGEGWRKQAPSM